MKYVKLFEKFRHSERVDLANAISLNENLAAANAYMHKRYLNKKKEDDSNVQPLTPEEKKQAEKDPEYQKVKTLLGDKIGFLYLFVKLYFEDGISIEDLRSLLERLEDKKKYLKDLPMNIDQYASITPSETDKRSAFERLNDDLVQLDIERSVDRFVRNLPGEFTDKNPDASDKGAIVPSFRNAARNATASQKAKLREIALAFDELGKNPKEKEALQRIFYIDCLRYRSFNELLMKAEEYIEASNNSSVVDLLITIDNVNKLYGLENGAQILYNSNNIVIFEVKSYQANVIINANTKHCIKDAYRHWLTYVSGEGVYNKQYYVWDFNLPSSSNKFIFGVTIYPDGKVRAAHWKDDDPISDVKKYVKDSLKLKFSDYFKPMNTNEVDFKKMRDSLNKEIVQSGATVEKIKSLLEQGADPNINEGILLKRAVAKNDFELVKYLLSKGAKATIGKPLESFVNDKTENSMNILITLIKNGAIIEQNKILRIMGDTNLVKILIESGVDFTSGKFLPATIGQDWMESFKLILDAGAQVSFRNYESLKFALALEKIEFADLIINKMIEKDVKLADTDYKQIMLALPKSNENAKRIRDELKKLVK